MEVTTHFLLIFQIHSVGRNTCRVLHYRPRTYGFGVYRPKNEPTIYYPDKWSNIKFPCRFESSLNTLLYVSDLKKRLYLCSECWLTQKLPTHQNVRNNCWWNTQQLMINKKINSGNNIKKLKFLSELK